MLTNDIINRLFVTSLVGKQFMIFGNYTPELTPELR